MENCRNHYLVKEDFMGFPIGDFPFDREHSAAGEYHCVPVQGCRGIWRDPVCNYEYRGPSWIITEAEGKHYMEQMRAETDSPHKMYPMLITGELQWKDYTAEILVRPLHTGGLTGMGVCAANSLNMVLAVLEEQQLRVYSLHKEKMELLAFAAFPYHCDAFYRIEGEISRNQMRVKIDGKEILKVSHPKLGRGGRFAMVSTRPAMFQEASLRVTEQTWEEICREKEKEQRRLEQKQAAYPGMKLWKTLDLGNFGCGRQMRMGHLTGTEEWYFVFAQCQKRVYQDAYATISALTAVSLEGEILWQRGEPSENPDMGMLTADVPLQVWDIDGDGIDEVITAKNFEILILDGRTGEVKKRAPTPLSVEEGSSLLGIPGGRYAFDRLNPDGIRICNLSGKDRPSDLLLKDRYSRLYAYDSDLNFLWKFQNGKNTGHFPFAHDFNGDGRDEIFCGYNMVDADGKLIWTLPLQDDHTDEIVAGKFRKGSGRGYLALASGTDGFVIADLQGRILFREGIGHAQRISIGNYMPEKEELGICLVNYWGHQGIIYFYDTEGNTLWEKETGHNGQVLTPVNWTGDGRDLILTNPVPKEGGLMDGEGDLAVPFPDDGHPVLCAEAADLTGEGYEKLLVWDQKRMYIYTPDRICGSGFWPVKYPYCNQSNYRGEYSYPDPWYLDFAEEL